MLEIPRNFLSLKGLEAGVTSCVKPPRSHLPRKPYLDSAYMPLADAHRAFKALLLSHFRSGSLSLIYSFLGKLKKMMLRVQKAPSLNTLWAKAA